MEVWKEIEDFPYYTVSNMGRVGNLSGKPFKTPLNAQGRPVVSLRRDQRTFTRSVSLLVASAFLEPDPRGPEYMTVIHLNGDKADVRADNLRYRTRPFAVAYHKQFEYYRDHDKIQPASFIVPLRDMDTGYIYKNGTECVMANGLLNHHLVVAVWNKEAVFPTWQRFEVVK